MCPSSLKLDLLLSFFLIILLVACQPVPGESSKIQDFESVLVTPSYSPDSQLFSHSFSDNPSEAASYSTASIIESKEYLVQERLALFNHGPGEPSKQNLWIALITDVFPYQQVLDTKIIPENYQLVSDENGNQFAEFDFSKMPVGTEIAVEIKYRVKVNHVVYDLLKCTGPLPDFYTQAELHIESMNPQIVSLASELSQGKETACEQVRSFYDYIGDNLIYSYNGRNWGAQATLGEMGADCTEYTSLMIALSRAKKIPARYLEGLYYSTNERTALARTEHTWLEVYLPGIGWTPMDPTLGRSSLTRNDYFAEMPSDHFIVSVGVNPSTLRGSNYWTHIYWPGNSTQIKIIESEWLIEPTQ